MTDRTAVRPSSRLLVDVFEFWVKHYRSTKSDATRAAIRVDFRNIATRLSDELGVPLEDLDIDQALTAGPLSAVFAAYGQTCAPASKKRCWSTWNTFCSKLVTLDVIDKNPMNEDMRETAPDRRPKPQTIPPDDISHLLITVATEDRNDVHAWRERDLVIILCGLLLGLRTAEMIALTIGDFTPRSNEPDSLSVRVTGGKRGKVRTLTCEPDLTRLIEVYLQSRRARFPETMPVGRRRNRSEWRRFDPKQPLLVGADGEAITRGTLQYRVKRAYAKAGIVATPGANTHRLRHTFAIQLAQSGVPLHMLMHLLGHANISSTQHYLNASGDYGREASRSNPIYQLIPSDEDPDD